MIEYQIIMFGFGVLFGIVIGYLLGIPRFKRGKTK